MKQSHAYRERNGFTEQYRTKNFLLSPSRMERQYFNSFLRTSTEVWLSQYLLVRKWGQETNYDLPEESNPAMLLR